MPLRLVIADCLVNFLVLLVPVTSHVSLTFPQSRFPPLDFLDSLRTKGPCGVPLPRKPFYTTLVAGQTYNVTWRMQYPHQGGYRLTLLDSAGNTVEQIAPLNGAEFAGTTDQTSLWERMKVSRSCTECTLLLQRQAVEWGRSYIFHSCADVHIVNHVDEATDCSGRGMKSGEICECDPGYIGDICQYPAHCQSDKDCQNGGKCMDEGTSLVKKACYCSYGFFGRNCENQFTGEPDDCFAYESRDEKGFSDYGVFNRNCYDSHAVNDQDTIYYRSVQDDVEVVLDFMTTSWVSLGWRPDGLDPSCRLFPDLEGVRSRRDAPLTKRDSMRELLLTEGNRRDGSSPPTRIAQEGPRPVMPKSNGMLDSAIRAPLHAMDCVDMIVGAVREGRTRVQDMYSRDRSTPLEDYWYDGMDSLSASVGVEIDGRTILMFRRPKQEIEPTDHPLGGSRQFVIWAKGQNNGEYSHAAPSALDRGPHSTPNFYQDDALNYHGDKNRGVLKVDLASNSGGAKHISESVAYGVPSQQLTPLAAHPPVIILSSSPSTFYPEAIQDTPPPAPETTDYPFYVETDASSSSRSSGFLVALIVLLLR